MTYADTIRSLAELQVLERDAPLADILAALDGDGGVIVRDLLSDDARQAIVDDVSAGFEGTAPGSKSGMDTRETLHLRNTVWFSGLAARSRAFVDHALLNPVFMAVADELLLANGADYSLNISQIMAVGPGESRSTCTVTTSSGLRRSSLTARSPSVAYLPFPTSPWRTGRPSSSPAARDGRRDWCAAPSRLPTRSPTPRCSGQRDDLLRQGHPRCRCEHDRGLRYAMHVSFVVSWLRPAEASPLVVDRARAESLPERARQLLGWGSYRSEGGGQTWLVDCEDASRLFD